MISSKELRFKEIREGTESMSMDVQKQKALEQKLELLKNQALVIVQATSPYRTGNLSRSFKIRLIEGGFEIYTDVSYMVYTEEKWISPKWRGRQNPNEAWFKETTEFIADYIARNLGGQYVPA